MNFLDRLDEYDPNDKDCYEAEENGCVRPADWRFEDDDGDEFCLCHTHYVEAKRKVTLGARFA